MGDIYYLGCCEELTKEMIEAGVRALSASNRDYDDREDIVARIYEAMRQASVSCAAANNDE